MRLLESCLALLALLLTQGQAILFVQRNEFRTYDELNGLWDFVKEPTNSAGLGLTNQWYLRDISLLPNATVMPVPSAYNDMTADAAYRDHVGWVWYQNQLYSPSTDDRFRTFLRFSSVNYYAKVWLNGHEVGSHIGGHLPFEFEVSGILRPGKMNRVTVAVNNTLTHNSIPPGDFQYIRREQEGVVKYREGFFKHLGNFDFFHYAGILRQVYVAKKPKDFIQDVKITADMNGAFTYSVKANSSTGEALGVRVRVLDGALEVATFRGFDNKGVVANVKPWWPRGMGAPNLYLMQIELVNSRTDSPVDIYRMEFGFRSVHWDNNQIYINSKPFYCIGFGMHEDSDIRGRAYDPVVMTKDLNLLEWMGANCYRTSHYPYAEERQYETDRRGIAVITEVPAVGLRTYPDENLILHMEMLKEMVERDRNHPSTFMWSLANEPITDKIEARPYFKALVDFTHSLDPTRPVTIVYGGNSFNTDKTADLIDVIGVNRYNGWYVDMGYLDTVNESLIFDITLWKRHFDKPIMITEYGADSLVGLSEEPSVDFSVQYQDELVKRSAEAFDYLRARKLLAGEMIWNFADFMTAQSTIRVVGNHKGVFTRARQPKMAAYTLRQRYLRLLNQA